jgi:hypothetical protein
VLIAGLLEASWPRLVAMLTFAVAAAVTITAAIWIHARATKKTTL